MMAANRNTPRCQSTRTGRPAWLTKYLTFFPCPDVLALTIMQNGRTVLRAFGDKLASAVFIGIMRTVNLGNDNLTGAATLAIKIVLAKSRK